MYRTDAANSVLTLPTPAALGTIGYFKNRSAAGDGTTVDADWVNMLMLTLLNVIDDQGITHSKSDYTQLTDAITSKIADEAPAEAAASTSVAGVIELATDAECRLMSATNRAITPGNIGATIMGTGLGPDGWAYLPGDPDNGDRFILQSRSQTIVDDLWTAVVWPHPFVNADYSVAMGGGSANVRWATRTTTQVSVYSFGTAPVCLIAFGAAAIADAP